MSSYEDQQGIIDVEKRMTQARYTLGDPTIFPSEFLSWLKRYIEQSGITLPASSIYGTFTAGAGSVRPLTPGLILAYGSTTPPSGSLVCDGTAVSRNLYAALFAAVGITWGNGDGSTTFNVPDLRDRALYGMGSVLSAIAGNDGGILGTRGPKHYHTAQSDGSHSHSAGSDTVGAHANHGGGGMTISSFGGGSAFTLTGSAQAWINGNITTSYGDHSHTITVNSGGAHTHTTTGGGIIDTPAYSTVLYVITTG